TAEFVVVFTTVLDELTAAQVLELYRARWQIELEFKRSKSIRELDRLPNFLPETIHSWICAKLILQLIATQIASSSEAFPPGEVRFALLADPEAAHATPRRRGRRTVVRGEVGVATGVLRVATGRAR
ncbi:MAG TPA: transposase, partial [Polyangiaceae bacterium]